MVAQHGFACNPMWQIDPTPIHNQLNTLVNISVYMYGVPYVGTVSDMPNIHNILTNEGCRFGHQSGLDETTG